MKKRIHTILCAVLCSMLMVPASPASKKRLIVEGIGVAVGLTALGVCIAARVYTGRKIAVLEKAGLMTRKNLKGVQIDILTLSPKEQAMLQKMITGNTSPKNLTILKHVSNAGMVLGGVVAVVSAAFGVKDAIALWKKEDSATVSSESVEKKVNKQERKDSGGENEELHEDAEVEATKVGKFRFVIIMKGKFRCEGGANYTYTIVKDVNGVIKTAIQFRDQPDDFLKVFTEDYVFPSGRCLGYNTQNNLWNVPQSYKTKNCVSFGNNEDLESFENQFRGQWGWREGSALWKERNFNSGTKVIKHDGKKWF